MGSGYAKEQYRERFGQGAPAWSGEKGGECVAGGVKQFGEHEVRETASGGYELSKGGMVVGSFGSGRVDPDRVVFPLSRGTWLEVSEQGTREVLSMEKALLAGLIASDGGNHFYPGTGKKKGSYYTTRFASEDRELMTLFDGLAKSVYNKSPGHYGKEGYTKGYISSKGVFYDLNDLGVKTGPDQFRVPREHLDDAGKRAYVKGFFSGDGSVGASIQRGRMNYMIRICSSDREGLEGIKEILEDLDFHPHEIHRREQEQEGRIEISYTFSIPAGEHSRFIHEIGSYKPAHIARFEEMLEEQGD
jgi:hypothetical protein